MRDSVLRAKTEYTDLGFDVLPLLPNSKKPMCARWQWRDADEMWKDAPTDANIGLRCGGDSQLAVFDADDKHDAQTSANLTQYFAGLGFDWADYATIATPSGGKHFDFRLDGNLPGNVRLLSPNLGAGEFRFGRGAYVGAPPSMVNGRDYRLIAGDFRTLARVDVRGVSPILANQETATIATLTAELAKPTISRHAWRLLQGKGIEGYHSRSEAEQAMIASLIASGKDFNAVLSLFIAYPCGGKFKELYAKNATNAEKWLRHSFEEARRFVDTHQSEGRRHADAALEWAQSHAWTGKTGAVDRAVYLACATIAYHSGCIEFAASCRAIAELAQVSRETATHSLHRLVDAGLLTLAKPSTVFLANVYCLHNLTLHKYSTVMKCQVMQTNHDAFRARGYGQTFKARGLGKSAGMVFNELRKGTPLTVEELAEKTGRHFSTVWRVLNRMARIVDGGTGEILTMVEQVHGGKWRACDDVDLDRIAKAVGTLGGNAEQRRRHAEERRKHRESLQPEDKRQ